MVTKEEAPKQTKPISTNHKFLVDFVNQTYYGGSEEKKVRNKLLNDPSAFDQALSYYHQAKYADKEYDDFRSRYLDKFGDPFKKAEPTPEPEVEPEKKKSLAEELSVPSDPGSQGDSPSPDNVTNNQPVPPVVPSDATRMVQTPELSEEQLQANREQAANQPEDVSVFTQEGFEKVASRIKPLAAIVRGMQMGNQADLLTAGDKSLGEEDLKQLAEIQKKLQDPRFKPSKEYERFTQATSFMEGLKEFSRNFDKIIPELTAESMTALLNHGISRVLAGANIGAAAGSVVPVFGTGAGAGAGAVTGLGLSSLNLEYSGSIIESLQEAGINVSDAESLKKGFSDEQMIDEARSHALKKGVPIALFDMLSAGLAGKIVSQPAKNLIGRAGQYSAELGMQAGMGMSGEFAGQSMAGEEIQPGAILAEGVGELGPGVVETAVGKKANQTTENAVLPPKVKEETTKPQTNEKVEKPENPAPDSGDHPGVEQPTNQPDTDRPKDVQKSNESSRPKDQEKKDTPTDQPGPKEKEPVRDPDGKESSEEVSEGKKIKSTQKLNIELDEDGAPLKTFNPVADESFDLNVDDVIQDYKGKEWKIYSIEKEGTILARSPQGIPMPIGVKKDGKILLSQDFNSELETQPEGKVKEFNDVLKKIDPQSQSNLSYQVSNVFGGQTYRYDPNTKEFQKVEEVGTLNNGDLTAGRPISKQEEQELYEEIAKGRVEIKAIDRKGTVGGDRILLKASPVDDPKAKARIIDSYKKMLDKGQMTQQEYDEVVKGLSEPTPTKEVEKTKEVIEDKVDELKEDAIDLSKDPKVQNAKLKEQKRDILEQMDEVENALWGDTPKDQRDKATEDFFKGKTNMPFDEEGLQRVKDLGYEVSEGGIITFHVKDDGTFRLNYETLPDAIKETKKQFPDKISKRPEVKVLPWDKKEGSRTTPAEKAKMRGSIEESEKRLNDAKHNLEQAKKDGNKGLIKFFTQEVEKEQKIYDEAVWQNLPEKSPTSKTTAEKPKSETKENLPPKEEKPTEKAEKEEKAEEKLPSKETPTPEYTPEAAFKDYKALIKEGDNRGEAVAKVAQKYGQKYMKVDDQLFSMERKERTSNGGSLKSKGSAPIHSFEKRESQKIADDAQGKLHEWAIDIIRKYSPKSRILQKHTGRKALGLFFTKSKNIAIKGLTDISVAFHELSHSLDDQHGIIKNLSDNNLKEQLRKLYLQYYPNALSTHPRKLQHIEGYATLLQKFIETPDIIRSEYPTLVKEFLTPEGKYSFPMVTDFLDDANQMVEDYFNMNPLQQVGSRVVDESVPERPKGVTEKMTQVADRAAEEIADNISQLEALTRKDGSFYTSDDAAQMMRLANKSAIFASNNIQSKQGYWVFNEEGEWVKKHDYNWKTIHSKLIKRKKELGANPEKAFGHWLVARRAHYDFLKLDELNEQLEDLQSKREEAIANEDEKKAGSLKVQINNLKEDINKITEIIQNDNFSRVQVEKAYNLGEKIFKEEAEMYDNLMQAQRDLLAHPMVGIISKEDLARMNENKGYASFARLMMDEITNEGIGEDVQLSKQKGGVKPGSLQQRKGSQKAIINPFLSGISSEAEVIRKSLQQATLNKIGKMAENHPDIFQKVPVETNYNETTKKASFPQERDPNYIVTRDNGKRSAYLVGPEIRRVIDENFTYDNVHIIFKVAQAAARLFRAGTTGWWLPFLATNIQMDQIASSANSRTNMIPFLSSSKEMFSALTNKNSKERQWYNEYVWLANISHTSGGWNKQSFRNLDVKFLDKSGKAKVVRYLDRIADIITAPANYSEIMTRATEYIRARRMGYPQHIALEQAGRVSASFHHTGRLGGSTGREFIRSVPYANASVQVLAQMARSLRTETGQKRYAFVMAALAASSAAALVYSMDDNDEETKELYKSLTPEELANSIYVKSPHSSKLIKLRTPSNMTFFSVLINMAIMETYANANYTDKEWFKGATAGVPDVFKPYEGIKWLMAITPNLLKGGLEVGLNKKSFPEIRDIETIFDQRVPVEERFDTWTSPVAKSLGRTELAKAFKLSPKKIDHLIGAYGGRTAQLLTLKPNRLKLPATFERELYFNSSRQVQWFYEFKEKYEQLGTQVRKEDAYDKYDSKYIDQVETYLSDISLINSLFDEYREVDENSEPKRANELQMEIFREIEKLKSKVN